MNALREHPEAQAAPPAGSPAAGPALNLRLAYLTTTYPKVSHTFIRRELLEVERRCGPVVRLAINGPPQAPIDPLDQRELARTHHCLRQSRLRLLGAAAWTLMTRPLRFFSALRLAVRMGAASERGVLRHLAYLVEACHLLRHVRAAGVRHVHVHFGTNAASVARLMRRLGGPPYSMTVHGQGEFDAPRSYDLRGKAADAEFVVAISHYCAAQLRRWLAFGDWRKLNVVRCAVDDAFLQAPPAERIELDKLVCVGRLCAEKGYPLLLDSLAELVRAGRRVRLVLAGDGELRGPIEAQIRALGLGEHVRITGYLTQREVIAEVQTARALVQPSFIEGLPLTIIEALALGRPVLASSVGAIPELVRHGEDGWLVPAGDGAALTAGLAEVLDAAPERLAAMGAAGRERVRAMHGLERIGREMEQLFVNGARGVPAAAEQAR